MIERVQETKKNCFSLTCFILGGVRMRSVRPGNGSGPGGGLFEWAPAQYSTYSCSAPPADRSIGRHGFHIIPHTAITVSERPSLALDSDTGNGDPL
jgi:hypothetical protein